MSNRVTLYKYADVSSRADLELSDNKLEIIEMSDYAGDGWQETMREEIPIEVLTKGIKLCGIQDKIEKKARHRWNRALFKLISKLDKGEITMSEFKNSIKYHKEKHAYPKRNPKLQGA